jgi:diguanylate cyclase (GGDEF)-like protein/PAS domain S-box-containing protein
MAQRASHTIGFITPFITDFYFGSILKGIQQATRAAGLRLLVAQRPKDSTYPLTIASNLVSGWIAMRQSYSADILAASGVPTVVISGSAPAAVSIAPDNQSGMRAAVRHLIAHGHRRIAFVGRQANPDIRERFAGYCDALAEAGLPLDPQLVFQALDELDVSGWEIARRLIELGMPCTAIAAATDMLAIGLIEVLQRAGYRFPEDLAIIGFDDILQSQTHDPPLSTVRQPLEMLGGRAVEMLVDLIAGREAPPSPTRVETLLITRRSCGCAGHPPEQFNPVPAEDAADHWKETLDQQLSDLLSHSMMPESDQLSRDLWPSRRVLVEALDTALQHREPPGAQSLEDAWAEVLSITGDLTVLNRLFTLIADTGWECLAARAPANDSRRSMARLIATLREALLRTSINGEREQTRYLNGVLLASAEIGSTLLGSATGSTIDLSWLRFTGTEWGYLGLWKTEEQPSLTVSGSYSRHGDHPNLNTHTFEARAFPPQHLFLDESPLQSDQIITLVPVRSPKHEWGMLVLSGVFRPETHSSVNITKIWTEMLGAELDRMALLNDLEVQTTTLRESEERYALAAMGTNDGLWDWDVRTSQVYYSPRWKALLGYAEAEIGDTSQDWFGRVHPDDLPILQRVIAQHHASRSAHFEVELRMMHHDGAYRWMLCRGTTVYTAQGSPQRLAGSISDISRRKRVEEQLRHSAFHDALTGLPNRSLLLDRLEQALQGAHRSPNHQFALLFLDLDRFKTINDSLGHLVGDLLLMSLAQRLQTLVRSSDTVARLGGDEFVVLLDGIADERDVTRMAQRIEEALRVPFNLNGHEVFASGSIGISIGAGHYERPEDLLRDADMAMYRAKALGRGRHEVFSAPLHLEAQQRLQLETDLHRALERQELRVFYQPIVSLATGQLIGAEALLRWEHPTRGLVPPQEFIPLAEETGLIAPIGRWVLRHACAQAQQWHRQGHSHLTISVNVSVRELQAPGFVRAVETTLEEIRLPAHSLILEMTESTSMEQVSLTSPVVERLRGLGVQIAFDDFGTGYSSLSYLRHFRVNRIKIDHSFIRDMTKGSDEQAITEAMIAMAHRLNITVVAEGVETREQWELLETYRCDAVQGYLISRPVPNEEFLALLSHPTMRVHPRGCTLLCACSQPHQPPSLPSEQAASWR